jgi:NhaP-type Na+/H+ or K+/H+ antiporter
VVDRLIEYTEKNKGISNSWKSIVIIALAFSCFSFAQLAGGSGFIACFTGGLLYSLLNRKYKHDLLEKAEGAGDSLSILTWIIFGSVVVATNLQFFNWKIILYALLSLTAIRIIPVLISLTNTRIPLSEKLFIGWFGPRGLASIVFTIIIIDIGLPHAHTIVLTAVCTILLSVVLHGFSANILIKLLNRNSPQPLSDH